MKQKGFLLLLLSVFVLSCATGPEPQAPPVSPPAPQESAPPEPVAPPPAPPPEEVGFNPAAVSVERYETTMAEIQALIAELNGIIRARNYSAWRGYLSDDYFERISSEEFLEERTEELYRRDQIVAQNAGRDPRNVRRRVLRTSRDFFDNVVVPSRSNDRVDDIAFVSETHIIAYTVDSRGNRLILYSLAMIDNMWKIVG